LISGGIGEGDFKECGIADFLARKWNSWQHHMTLVSLAMLFGLRERLHHNSVDGLLTYQDIVEEYFSDLNCLGFIRLRESRYYRTLRETFL
jgi:hypothetical protein